MSIEVFRKFPTRDEANFLIELLDKNEIPYRLEDYSKQADTNFMGQNLDLKVIVKARIVDFPKIEELLDDANEITFDQVDKEHYLFDFSDDELTEIIVKPNEWSNYDYKVATLILNERGCTVSPRFIESIKKQRYNQLSEKESYSSLWIIIGYVSAFCSGLLGFAIGLSLWLMKKKLPNGEKVHIYDDKTRIHGKRITLIGLAMTAVGVFIRIYWS
ncbi:hypothetical protein DMA11_00070 [Marinilabiliaceae bacterium JC017]|nr:hypothetical protein DMA11_00070 [Marinilabiliaceae bacterium JC017]